MGKERAALAFRPSRRFNWHRFGAESVEQRRDARRAAGFRRARNAGAGRWKASTSSTSTSIPMITVLAWASWNRLKVV
jgi:hypothetical protein